MGVVSENKRKVLIIGGASIGESPYITFYIEMLERNSIPYSFVFWNRRLDETEHLPKNYIPYNRFSDTRYPFWRRAIGIGRYTRFVKRHIINNDYSVIVVFTIAHAVFLSRLLLKQYKGKFVFDIRDYSPLLRLKVIHRIVEKLVARSSITVISSSGFLRWLPTGEEYSYQIAHNTNLNMIDRFFYRRNVTYSSSSNNGVISILTIGQIRDFEANSLLMSRLKNDSRFKMVFSGYGIAADSLIGYAREHSIDNVLFTGRYRKEDEEDLVKTNHMINSYLNSDINSESLMSNRFYLSVLLRKPLIVNAGSFQAELVNKYRLGVVLDKNDSFSDKIMEWWDSFDEEEYNQGCECFLAKVKTDLEGLYDRLMTLFSET